MKKPILILLLFALTIPIIAQTTVRQKDQWGAKLYYIDNQTIKQMNLKGVPVKDARILILGFSFKENCPDIRNTKVVDIYHTLREYTSNITVLDPWVDAGKALAEYGIEIQKSDGSIKNSHYDAAILAVSHHQFANINIRELVPQPGVVYDVKGVLPRHLIDARL